MYFLRLYVSLFDDSMWTRLYFNRGRVLHTFLPRIFGTNENSKQLKDVFLITNFSS